MRLFFAIFPPEEVLEEAFRFQQSLRGAITRQGVRFTRPNKIHLTLAFLGDDFEIDSAQTQARSIAAEHPRQEMRLADFGCFPTSKRPKTIWVGIDGPTVCALGSAIQSRFGLRDEPFVPHMTVARVAPASQAVGRLLQPLAGSFQSGIHWTAESFDLVSTLGNGQYEIVSSFRLTGNS